MADCYKLTAVDDFTKYVETLSDETGYEDSRLQACKPVICQAIYGIGNPDISGIGVAIGYIIGIALGFTLAILLLLQTRLDPPLKSIPSQVLLTGLRSFFNAAAFFSIAVQIATISLLVQKDFGIATSDFGAIEAQIAQAVSVVSLLPLLYPALILSSIDSSRSNPRLFLLNLAAALRVGEWLRGHRLWAALLMLVPLGLAAPLLWVIFHLRGLQEELARNVDEDYGGNSWGFGQIVAVVLYLPVAVDMFYRGRFGYQV
ncbi:unnamed protein product [Clonostachys rosea f. rosea IK726]|uniref:Uncharacterized protein n=1 Tax=Clonostachys rosea f. rosea IK726 TaxID=1349383 RepID=A0ACA9TVQ0_BIOOC|nr:unnamed protein product [Clonostachys rosea f. rosea IK726]